MLIIFVQIEAAYLNARNKQIWEPNSYAMSNEAEYFAEAAGVFFNVNNHFISTGGMNRSVEPIHNCVTFKLTKMSHEREHHFHVHMFKVIIHCSPVTGRGYTKEAC